MKNSPESNITCHCGRSFTARGFSRHKCDQKPEIIKCEFCKQTFSNEKRLLNHLCEQKRRYIQKDDKTTKLGYMAYEHFFRRSIGKVPTYESFMKSKLYGAFVRFGKHIIDLNAISPMGFVDYLLKTNTPVDNWLSLTVYEKYVQELNKNEAAVDALERNFTLMQEWASENGEDWSNFFRRVATPLATLWITNGRISPWILFTASTAHDLFDRLSPEQEELIQKTINPDFWKLKLERHKEDVEIIRATLAEYGI